MNDTVPEQPLVREYLRELDKASLTLPAAQARELREQITAHLAEALPPGARQIRSAMNSADSAAPAPSRPRRRARLLARWASGCEYGWLASAGGPGSSLPRSSRPPGPR